MSSNPFNLLIRFLLELGILAALGRWGWIEGEGFWKWILAFGLPLIAAFLWGTFRVPGDPKEAVVAIPGILRLLLEIILFSSAAWALYDLKELKLFWIFTSISMIHYLTSYDRIAWLLSKLNNQFLRQ